MTLSAAFLFQIAFLLLQSRAGVVTGQLRSREGPPAVGVRVSAVAASAPGSPEKPSDTIVASAVTDATGQYRLEGITPGQYYITAGLVDIPSYYPGVTKATEAKVVPVAAGAVKSFFEGKTDLQQEPLKLAAGASREISVTLGVNPAKEEAQ